MIGQLTRLCTTRWHSDALLCWLRDFLLEIELDLARDWIRCIGVVCTMGPSSWLTQADRGEPSTRHIITLTTRIERDGMKDSTWRSAMAMHDSLCRPWDFLSEIELALARDWNGRCADTNPLTLHHGPSSWPTQADRREPSTQNRRGV